MLARQKESPCHAPTWNRGKKQSKGKFFVPQGSAQVKNEARNCFECCHFQRFGLHPGTARLCAFNGRIVYGRFLEPGCIGFHARPGVFVEGEW